MFFEGGEGIFWGQEVGASFKDLCLQKWCGVVIWKFRLASFCKDVKA